MERKYNELLKLKKMLEDAHIPFDWIENWGYDDAKLKEMKRISPELIERYQICYPMFDNSGRVLSAIQGFGTYGAEQDLIEIMGILTPEEAKHDCVVGYLTAENVFDRIQNHYKKNHKREEITVMKKVKVVDEDTLALKEVEVSEERTSEEDVLDVYAPRLRAALNCEPEEFYEKYKKYKTAEAEFKKVYEPFKEDLIQLHADVPDFPMCIIVGGAKLTYVSPSIRNTIDTKKLKEEEPELAKKYTKTTSVKASVRLEDI